jgi:hypothetical protein
LTVKVGETVTFDGSASYTVYGAPQTYDFREVEGEFYYQGPNPTITHTYTEEGTYTVQLIVRDRLRWSITPSTVKITVESADVELAGHLFAGGYRADPDEEWSPSYDFFFSNGPTYATVYKYVGGTSWEKISPPDGVGLGADKAVISLCEYNGKLYAGTDGYSNEGGDKIWRYDGGTNWTLIAGDEGLPGSFAVFGGKLYAGIADFEGDIDGEAKSGKLLIYDAQESGYTVIEFSADAYDNWDGITSLYVCDITGSNLLYLGGAYTGVIAHYDGANFVKDVNITEGAYAYGIHDFQYYNNELYAVTDNEDFAVSSDGINWDSIICDHIPHSLEVFKDYLYGDDGEWLFKYDGTEFDIIWPSEAASITYLLSTDNVLLLANNVCYCYAEYSGYGEVYAYDGVDTGLQKLTDEGGIEAGMTGVSAIETLLFSANLSD